MTTMIMQLEQGFKKCQKLCTTALWSGAMCLYTNHLLCLQLFILVFVLQVLYSFQVLFFQILSSFFFILPSFHPFFAFNPALPSSLSFKFRFPNSHSLPFHIFQNFMGCSLFALIFTVFVLDALFFVHGIDTLHHR